MMMVMMMMNDDNNELDYFERFSETLNNFI